MLATLKNASRDGCLVVVSRELQRAVDAALIVPNNAGHCIVDWVAETLGRRTAKSQRAEANANTAS